MRGRKPQAIVELDNALLDQAAALDDDRLNDAHTLELFDAALADGSIDLEEAFAIRRHLRLDQELTRISAGLNRSANRHFDAVVALARKRSTSASEEALAHTRSL